MEILVGVGLAILFCFVYYLVNILLKYAFVRSIENDEGKVVDDESLPLLEEYSKNISW